MNNERLRMSQTSHRPIARRDASKTPAPETTEIDTRARELSVETEELDEVATRAKPRVRQITGGDVHWFQGSVMARETR